MRFIDFPEVHFPVQGIEEIRIPRMLRVRQKFADDRLEDPAAYLAQELEKKDYGDRVRGKRIAVTVGSRGIPCNAELVRAICGKLKEWGGFPFVVPAMGSHGSGCVEGNLEVLEGYGITEEKIGAPIRATMEVVQIGVFSREELIEGDRQLLAIAKSRFPRFKFDNIDVLIIDRIGKNISGEGADPNVTGRGFMPYFQDDFHTRRLFIRGLTEESHHNACGLGLADITTRRCLNTVDWEGTWINLTTNTMIEGGKIPMYQNNDAEAIRLAIRTCTKIDYNQARVVRIRDTLSLNEFEVSESMREEIEGKEDMEILEGPYELQFDREGYLEDFIC